MTLVKKYVGDKIFYKSVMAVAIPMIIQSLITNFVSLLDNIMVGQVGTAQMSGVAIANQLLFIFMISIFGGLSGIGIFTAQFFGARDEEGVKATIWMKIVTGAVLLLGFVVVVLIWGMNLISLFLTAGDDPAQVEITLTEGMKYLNIMLIGLPPFVASQVFGSTIKEFGETKLPMIAGVTAVIMNLIGNYIFIFGHFGAPAMGVAGAAVATVIARFVEAGIVLFVSHRHTDRFTFLDGLYQKIQMPQGLVRKVVVMGSPLMANEFLWSVGVAAITQSYSTRGLSAVAAVNINSTIINLFNVMVFSFGTVITIFVGQALGANEMEKAKDLNRKIMAFALFISIVTGLIAVVLAPLFPQLYNVTEEVKTLATDLLRVSAFCMPIGCLVYTCYFTLRSGGKTVITFLFDSVFICLVGYPVSFVLSRYTGMGLIPLYLTVSLLDLIKVVIGVVLVKKGVWINNLVKKES